MTRLHVRANVLAVLVGALAAAAGGCRKSETPPEQTAYRPTATVKDIMTSIIDPQSDVLWNSVATIVTLTGTEERAPQTEEEWEELRRSAVQVVEATNLLRVPGRLVARPGEKSENPRIELQPETIQKLIADDPGTWTTLVDRLHDAAAPALKAIEAKDVKGLFDAGEQMEHACEACHQQYWYPPSHAAAWKHEADAPSVSAAPVAAPAPSDLGTIQGHVAVMGRIPGNQVIRMGLDPLCASLNAGKRPVQEVVAAQADGSLANVFVNIQGSFPAAPPPSQPVTINQSGCLYTPRVVGAQVGQAVQVRNNDALLHNVHSTSGRNGFNFSQPKAGLVQELRLSQPEIMVRVGCDVHRWMTAFVGVVSHPYFATSDGRGSFTIANVPAGTHVVQAWHELFGVLTQKVNVVAGGTAKIELSYAGQ